VANDSDLWQYMCWLVQVPLSLNDLTNLFKALSDTTRLRVVNLLRRQSLSVGDLQVVLGLPQPAVSQQLAILRAAKLVRATRQGHRICYSLARAPILTYPLGRFLSEVAPFFPELAVDAKKLVDFKGDNTCCSPQNEELARSGQV